MFETWEDFLKKSCSASDCGKKLISDPPVALVFENNMWFHEPCLLRAKRAFAQARRLAKLGYYIAEYVAIRENTEVPDGI